MMIIMTKTIKENKIANFRLDIVSQKFYDKKTMLRIVKTKNRKIKIDRLQNIAGKGAYIKLSVDNVLLLTKRRFLNRALKAKINPKFYEELLEYAKECNNE